MKDKRFWKIAGAIVVALVLLWATSIALAKPPAQEPVEFSKEKITPQLNLQGDISISANVHRYLPIQGQLTNKSGVPINGTRTVTYTLYKDNAGKICENVVNDMKFDENGNFNYLMWCEGKASKIDGPQVFLGITVDGDAEMDDIIPLYPVPYAFSLVPGAYIKGTIDGWSTLWMQNYGIEQADAVGNVYPAMGVYGYTSASTSTTYGVFGQSDSDKGRGVYGYNASSGVGVVAKSEYGNPLEAYGVITTSPVFSVSNNGNVYAGNVYAMSVYGYISATTSTTYGVQGRSDSDEGRGVYGYNASSGVGVVAKSENGNPLEAYGVITSSPVFSVSNSGNVYADGGYNCGNSITDTYTSISSTLTITALNESDLELGPCLTDNSPADFAEMLPATVGLEPGDVLVIGPDGELARSTIAYQSSVVGVHSSRPSYLGNSKHWGQEDYAPLAMVGIVPVKASAENGPIQPGNLLVASSTPGYAMQADFNPPTGTVIGKALEGLDKETGVIQMLVMLQ